MSKLSISQIEEKLADIGNELDPFVQELIVDDRKGVQQCLNKWRKKREHEKSLQDKFREMSHYESKIRAQGFQFIAGIDEVGRGPLAGPVVAAAVILPDHFYLPGIDDSKKLSEKKRMEYNEIIKKEAISLGVVMISAQEIDEMNIYEATKRAMKTAISSLKPNPDYLLIDAMRLETPFPYESIIKGDAKSVSIAAASIVAKVARDEWMKEVGKEYPGYGFEQHMGYGTREHIAAIKKYGITPYHRKTFSPIKELVEPNLFEFLN